MKFCKAVKAVSKNFVSLSFQFTLSSPKLYLNLNGQFQDEDDICCLLFDNFQKWVSILGICASFCHLFEAVIRLSDWNIPSHFLRKGRCNSKSAESFTFAVFAWSHSSNHSNYWTIDVNLPNFMWSALSRCSYKKQPAYLRQ